jgi:hypothetical protein
MQPTLFQYKRKYLGNTEIHLVLLKMIPGAQKSKQRHKEGAPIFSRRYNLCSFT